VVIRVEEVMTMGVIALKETDTAQQANDEMRRAGIRHLPVIGHGRRVIGIVSTRDVLAALALPGGEDTRVSEIMNRTIYIVRPETPAYRAVELMLDKKIGALPVLGNEDELVGIVTESDFLGVAHNALHGRTGSELLNV
jgi:CBS domain-containing protein